jgi:hypothetical protein
MYVSINGGLGDDKVSKPKSPTLAMRPKPYLNLDRFNFNESSLTARLTGRVNDLAQAITQSWNINQPITRIRLIGHTDSTGKETYNIGLGDRRANAVKAALQGKLTGLLSRVNIMVGPSPGESEPRADNRTREGRATNRRVEVFVTVTAQAGKAVDLWNVTPIPDPIIRTTPAPYWQPIPRPTGGKSLSDRLDEVLRRAPSWLRPRIRDAILSGACSALATLLEEALLSGADKEALKAMCKATAQTKSR